MAGKGCGNRRRVLPLTFLTLRAQQTSQRFGWPFLRRLPLAASKA